MYQCMNVSMYHSLFQTLTKLLSGHTGERALDDHLMISLRPIFAIMRSRHHNGKNRPEGDHNWSSRALYPLCPDSHFVNGIIRRGHQRVICWRASDEGIITEASGGEGRPPNWVTPGGDMLEDKGKIILDNLHQASVIITSMSFWRGYYKQGLG